MGRCAASGGADVPRKHADTQALHDKIGALEKSIVRAPSIPTYMRHPCSNASRPKRAVPHPQAKKHRLFKRVGRIIWLLSMRGVCREIQGIIVKCRAYSNA